ncbi:MAG TPA: hypothetical protein PLO24_03060 [Bacteroidales bacterium]|nr:hypothetical protein [Bacteroidales bacterium]HOS72443.1 hypothetical protein [Bacteroidales bacterium]HQH25129.1 hypothetical protein [Bacteroidales bacterium]HQJ83449.1 hypothetical protein [Bacteroidales bacterium]
MKHICNVLERSLLMSVIAVFLISADLHEHSGNFKIGWASADITPDKPVLIAGQFHARVMEGVMDPITATALALESGSGPSSAKIIMISCDLVSISDGMRDGSPDNLRDNVRELLKHTIPEVSPEQIFLNATHTHTAPLVGSARNSESVYGVELDVLSPADCQKYIAERIARAAEKAWKSRRAGGISFGLGHAVVGHNRLTVDKDGRSTMYKRPDTPGFSHVEGYEDHSLNLLYTWDDRNNLTGIVVNVPCPAQVTEGRFMISADYWNETRIELRGRLGDEIHILPQCSAAGDQSPHVLIGEKAEARMQKLMFSDSITGGQTLAHRKQIALRIADAVTSILPYMKSSIDRDPVFEHKMEIVELSRRLIDTADVNNALRESETYREQYNELISEIRNNPDATLKPRWYTGISQIHTLMKRGESVKERYELEKIQPRMPVEVHVLRIGDMVIATNPFELYLDYGMRIKGRSPAIQTFLVQLAGSGSYLPPQRSVAGGSYGAVPASTLMGPEGGQELVEKTLEMISSLWQVQ